MGKKSAVATLSTERLSEMFTQAALRAAHKHAVILDVSTPVQPHLLTSRDGKCYDRAFPAGIDAHYADTGMDYVGVDTSDWVREQHREHGNKAALSEDSAFIRNNLEQILLHAHKNIYFVGQNVEPSNVVMLCDKLADDAVGNAVVFGNEKESLVYAKQFLTEFRHEYAQVCSDMQTLGALKRCEDKLDIGLEAIGVIERKCTFREGCRDFFDLGLARVMEQKRAEHGEDVKPDDDDIKMAGLQANGIYAFSMRDLGIANDTKPMVTFYGFAVLQRAVYVAEVEFMRLPKDHPLKQGSVSQGLTIYRTKRAPELVQEAYMRFPPVAAENAKEVKLGPYNSYTHDTKALFGAIEWLDAQRALVAERSR